jgi:hypothetical protein
MAQYSSCGSPNRHACTNSRAVGSDVFYVVHAKATYNKDQFPLYVYSRGGPQTAPAPRPSLIYCALPVSIREQLRENLQADSQLRGALAEAGDTAGTQRMGNVCRWKPLPRSTVKTTTENTSLCDSDL